MPIPIVPVAGILDQTPDPYQKNSRFRVSRNNRKGRVELTTSRDNGETFNVLIPEVTPKVKPGSVPMVQENGDVEWSPVASRSSSANHGSVIYVEMMQAGTLVLDNQFGLYVAPVFDVKCIGIQFALQSPSAGAAVKVVLITTAGVEAQTVVSIPAAATYANTTIASPISMNAGTAWRLKIKQVGSSIPGEFLFARLVLVPV